MTRTRLVVIGALLVLAAGLGAGLATYLGTRGPGLSAQGVPGELGMIPADAALVAHVDLRRIMESDLRQHIEPMLSAGFEARRRFQDLTGIDLEHDVDHLFVGLVPAREDTRANGDAVVLLRGRFDRGRIEALTRQRGARAEDYKGVRLVLDVHEDELGTMSIAFLETGLLAVGRVPLVRSVVDAQAGGASLASNGNMMRLLAPVTSAHVWAVGRLDALSHADLPQEMAGRMPPLDYITVAAQVDGGVHGLIRLDARDEQAATTLRDTIRGGLAIAKMQAASRPEARRAIDALQLGGTGTTVTLAFDVPASAFAAIGSLAPQMPRRSRPQAQP